ncbi:MAG: hypothetical protein HY291_11635 [Planctomycetes bacterium]|nr:hypothetical protein [Planctomycetota bacterium]
MSKKERRGGVREGAGRPTKAASEMHSKALLVRFTAEEFKQLKARANGQGVSMAEYLRQSGGFTK